MIVNNYFKKNKISLIIFSIIIPLVFYALILIIPFPKEIALDARYGIGTILIILILLLYPAYRLSGWLGILASLSGTLILFALPLAAVWNSGLSDQSILSGLFPWNDAYGYYTDAKQVLEGNRLSVFSSRRPLFAAMLTFLLGISQQNLQFSLAILVLLTAVSCFFLAREIQNSHGIASGLFTLIITFLFYRRFAGTTLTENLGLPLGTIGFALLWRGANKKQISVCLVGTFLITLALNARAGAFFILPAILLWGTLSFKNQRRFSLHFLVAGIGTILLGFLVNQIILKVLGSLDGVAFANFAHTLYGLVVGGKSWTQIYVDYPGVAEKEMYPLVLEAFRQNPFGIVVGAFKAWYDYFDPNGLGLFSFIGFSQGPLISSRTRQILYLLSYLSFFYCCYRWRRYENSLMIALTVGILLSVPFVPPSDADVMRAYAATIPISATLPVLILIPFFRKLKWHSLLKTSGFDLGLKPPLFFGIALTILCFVAPITTKLVSKPSQFAEISCQNNVKPLYMKFRVGSFVKLVEDNSIPQTHLPNIRISDFKNGFEIFSVGFPELTEELKGLSPSKTIISGFDLQTGRFVILIAESAMMPKENAIIGICEQREANPILNKYNFFMAEDVHFGIPSNSR